MSYRRLENHERIEEDVDIRHTIDGDIAINDGASDENNEIFEFFRDKLAPGPFQILLSLSNGENDGSLQPLLQDNTAIQQLNEIHKFMVTTIRNLQIEVRLQSETCAKLKKRAKKTQRLHACYIFYSLLCVIILIFAVILIVFLPSYQQHWFLSNQAKPLCMFLNRTTTVSNAYQNFILLNLERT